MATLVDIHDAIRSRFDTQVATPNSITILHDNQPPTAITQQRYRLSISEDSSEQVHVGASGARRYRIKGTAVLTLYAPASMGDNTMVGIMDDVLTAFRGVAISAQSILFRPEPYPSGAPVRGDGYFMRTMVIPFEADQFG